MLYKKKGTLGYIDATNNKNKRILYRRTDLQ